VAKDADDMSSRFDCDRQTDRQTDIATAQRIPGYTERPVCKNTIFDLFGSGK